MSCLKIKMLLTALLSLQSSTSAQPQPVPVGWSRSPACEKTHHVYGSVAAMIADVSHLQPQTYAETVSYLATDSSTGQAHGGQVYRIESTAPVPPDGGRVINLGNGLFALAGFEHFVSPFDYGASGDPLEDADNAVTRSFSTAMTLDLPWDVSNGSFRYSTDLVVPASTGSRRIQGSGRSVESSSTSTPSHSLLYEGSGTALTIGEAYQGGAGAPLFGFLVRDVNILASTSCQTMVAVRYAPSLQMRGVLTGGSNTARPAAGLVLAEGAYSGQYESVQVVNIDGPGWLIGQVNNTTLVMCGASTVFNGYEIDLDNADNLNVISCQMTNAKDVSGDGLTGNGFLLHSGININIFGAYTDGAGNQHADIYSLGDRGVVGGVTVTGNTVNYAGASVRIALASGFTMVGGFLRSIEVSGPASLTRGVVMANVDRSSFSADVSDPNGVITWIGDDVECASLTVDSQVAQDPGVVLRGGSAEVGLYSGAGSPQGVVVADIGSLYLRRDGTQGATLYVKESGSGTSTGWESK